MSEGHFSPTMTTAVKPPIDQEEYEDILGERRNSSDLRFAVREWKPLAIYRYGRTMEAEEMFQKVLHSERVQSAISQASAEGKSKSVLVNEVKQILHQMGHTLDISNIRKFAFTLPKIMKKIYGKVLVNKDGINKILSCIPDVPVIFLPTHRSYADFLLVSYLAYHFNMPIPVIAAGMDFMSMAIIGEWLRGSGAFYIRRSFMCDGLYWAVFQEYVQTLVQSVGCPMEFFLEGTRSRSGKSLPPKLGLLGCIAQCWLRAGVPDLAFVPISISYDRTLEEKLYSYELLGVSKPPESTSGLMKAAGILKENFGDIRVHIGEPVYAHAFLDPLVDRWLLATQPVHITPLSVKELCACDTLALHLLRKLQQGCYISVWSLACIFLLEALQEGKWSVPLEWLVEEVGELARVVEMAHGCVSGQGGCLKESLIASFDVHRQLVKLAPDGTVTVLKVHIPAVVASSKNRNNHKIALAEPTVVNAVSHLMLQYYVNQTMHLFVRPALVATAITSELRRQHICTLEDLLATFSLLRRLFSLDFIFEKKSEDKDLAEGLSVLTANGEVTVSGITVSIVGDNSQLLATLQRLMKPFFATYRAAIEFVNANDCRDDSHLANAIQLSVEKGTSRSQVYSALSLDSTRHALRALTKMAAINRILRNDDYFMVPNVGQLEKILNCFPIEETVPLARL